MSGQDAAIWAEAAVRHFGGLARMDLDDPSLHEMLFEMMKATVALCARNGWSFSMMAAKAEEDAGDDDRG